VSDEPVIPFVTLVVPAYNAACSLPSALESLLAQTRDDWEAFVVDDGSSDGTAAVAGRFAELDNRVRVLRQDNAGVSVARNTAMRAARGKYLAFLDADDTVEPDFVEKLRVLVGGATPDVLALTYKALPRGNAFGYGAFEGDAADFLIQALSSKYATFPCWLFAVSNHLVSEEGIQFVEGRRTGEDQEFILKALCAASTCQSAKVNDNFYIYRTTSEASAMSSNLEGQFDYPRAMLGVLEYFEAHKGRLDTVRADQIGRLLTDRFVGACSYASEMALANGASNTDVLAWVGDVLKEGERSIDYASLELGRSNSLFVGVWRRLRLLLPCYIRARRGVYRAGRSLKRFAKGRR
jgi:hypothetical protein